MIFITGSKEHVLNWIQKHLNIQLETDIALTLSRLGALSAHVIEDPSMFLGG